MTDLFVEYALAMKLRDAGFAASCVGWYFHETLIVDGNFAGSDLTKNGFSEPVIRAPIYQQVFDWLETKNLYIKCPRMTNMYMVHIESIAHFVLWSHHDGNNLPVLYRSKKEAWDVGIERALILLKERSNTEAKRQNKRPQFKKKKKKTVKDKDNATAILSHQEYERAEHRLNTLIAKGDENLSHEERMEYEELLDATLAWENSLLSKTHQKMVDYIEKRHVLKGQVLHRHGQTKENLE